jgi:release factor glutamine methyltransferase
MLLKELVTQTTNDLTDVSEHPALEAKLLLCYVLDSSEQDLILNSDSDISDIHIEELHRLINLRLNSRLPIEYITNTRYFYKSDFYIDKRVLVPRPETELLVEQAVKTCMALIAENQNDEINILEIGTGSGCIPISLILDILKPVIASKVRLNLISTDISNDSLDVAQINTKKLLQEFKPVSVNGGVVEYRYENVNLTYIHADVIKPIGLNSDSTSISKLQYDLIISNPPYIPSHEIRELSQEVHKEPMKALDGGTVGLDIIKAILDETKHMTKRRFQYLIEIASNTTLQLKELLSEYPELQNYTLHNDLSSNPRILEIRS